MSGEQPCTFWTRRSTTATSYHASKARLHRCAFMGFSSPFNNVGPSHTELRNRIDNPTITDSGLVHYSNLKIWGYPRLEWAFRRHWSLKSYRKRRGNRGLVMHQELLCTKMVSPPSNFGAWCWLKTGYGSQKLIPPLKPLFLNPNSMNSFFKGLFRFI